MTRPSSPSCPICDDSCADVRELRGHLMGRHRKSELTDLVVERVDLPEPVATLP